MALFGWILAGTVVIVVGLAATGAILYATDYKVDASVQETNCGLAQVKVHTKQFGLHHTVTDIPLQQCLLLNPGNFVEYRIRTQRTTLYASEGGDCIYDSLTGPC